MESVGESVRHDGTPHKFPTADSRFEIIDADGSGTLHITELVHGLLKIRGDVKRPG